MGAVLPGAEDQIDLAGRRVVATEDLGGLGGEVRLAADEGEAVRPAERAEIDGRQWLGRLEIDHRQRVIRAEAVVRDVRGGPVGGGDHLMGIVPHRYPGGHLQCAGVDNGESLVVLREHQQGSGLPLADRCCGKQKDGGKQNLHGCQLTRKSNLGEAARQVGL